MPKSGGDQPELDKQKETVASLSTRTNAAKKQTGRSVSVNGVHAIDVTLKRSQNINDPILDVGVRVNNPIGRILLALKRIWKNQNTIIGLKFTIPLLVLPILMFAGWRLWQGRGAHEPVSKLGYMHQVRVQGKNRDVLVMQTNDVYMLEYSSADAERTRILQKPVIVVGTYDTIKNVLSVEQVIAFNEIDSVRPSVDQTGQTQSSLWGILWGYIQQFR